MVNVSAESRPLNRPIVGQYVDRHAADTVADVLVDMSTDISRSIYRPSVGWYVNRHIGRVSVNISADTSVDYRSTCRPIYRSRGAQNTLDPLDRPIVDRWAKTLRGQKGWDNTLIEQRPPFWPSTLVRFDLDRPGFAKNSVDSHCPEWL